MRRKQRAFSLLELIVVLAIIGILLTVVSVRLNGTLLEAQKTRIDSDLAILVTAAEQFSARHPEEEAREQETLVEAGVLANVLESPVEGYQYAVRAGDGKAEAALMKGDEVYARGSWKAQAHSTRLYVD